MLRFKELFKTFGQYLPLPYMKRPLFASLWGEDTLSDATLKLCLADKSVNALYSISLPVHRTLLAVNSEYFKARLLRWPGRGLQGAASFQPSTVVAHFGKTGSLPSGLTVSQLAQETFDSQAECDAARLVVRCMYEGELAEEVKDPLTLARVCRVAERWAFPSLSSSCLQRLADLPPSQLPAEQLVLVLQTLPDSCALLPEHKKWQKLVNSLIVGLYKDVHAVITSPQLREYFQQLPFAAVQKWAGSDELTVESENSVVELISLWLAGPGGQACSKEQKQQLSCLVRVQHLSPAYAIGRLPALDWFDIPGASTPLVAQAACCGFGMTGVMSRSPPAWFAAPREAIHPVDLLERSTIRWDVPRQQLVDLLASEDLTAKIYSDPVYSAGVGWRVYLTLVKGSKDEPGFTLGCWGQLVPYAECKGHALGAKLPHGTPIKQVITKGYRVMCAVTVALGYGDTKLLHCPSP
ncbi:hypothetical protein V8C86DRAFT_3139072 [Haematococcus lacustris]